eukprot:6405653-Amphidinium_carterae.1
MAHVDKNNFGNGMNFVLHWEEYTGGEFWEGKGKNNGNKCRKWSQIQHHIFLDWTTGARLRFSPANRLDTKAREAQPNQRLRVSSK